jgi:F-box and leucine-rich repeat protein GRR1
MAVSELGGLPELRGLNVSRCGNVTDNGVLFLAEHARRLERLHLAHCALVRADAVRVLLERCARLALLSLTGVPAFGARVFARMADAPPAGVRRL